MTELNFIENNDSAALSETPGTRPSWVTNVVDAVWVSKEKAETAFVRSNTWTLEYCQKTSFEEGDYILLMEPDKDPEDYRLLYFVRSGQLNGPISYQKVSNSVFMEEFIEHHDLYQSKLAKLLFPLGGAAIASVIPLTSGSVMTAGLTDVVLSVVWVAFLAFMSDMIRRTVIADRSYGHRFQRSVERRRRSFQKSIHLKLTPNMRSFSFKNKKKDPEISGRSGYLG